MPAWCCVEHVYCSTGTHHSALQECPQPAASSLPGVETRSQNMFSSPWAMQVSFHCQGYRVINHTHPLSDTPTTFPEALRPQHGLFQPTLPYCSYPPFVAVPPVPPYYHVPGPSPQYGRLPLSLEAAPSLFPLAVVPQTGITQQSTACSLGRATMPPGIPGTLY